MSKYTTEVRFICEKEAGYDESVGYSKVDEILDQTWDKVFDFSFPIFDENYRSVLCKKILKHYYTREIGFETVGLWKLKLNMMMNEIMPYYNKLYDSELLDFDPFYDTDYYKDHKGRDAGTGNENRTHTGNVEDDGKHTGTVNDEVSHTGTIGDSGTHGGTVTDAGTHGGTIGDVGAKSGEKHDIGTVDLDETTWDVYSDTPQGALTNVENETYLTNARKITHSADTRTTDDSAYSESDSNTRTFNETNGNTRTYNETNGNTRTYDESNDNVRTYDEKTGNVRTYDEASDTERSFSNTDEYLDHIFGKTPGKSYMQLIRELRDNFLNIDVDIIGDLSDLFIKLW